MDKGIKISVFLAALLSLAAAFFWDSIVEQQDKNTEQPDSQEKVMPNRDTIQYHIVNTPYRDSLPKTNPKPDKQPKPTRRFVSSPNTNDANKIEVSSIDDKPADRVHIVKRGDSLRKISRIYYGTENHWEFVQKYNKLNSINVLIGQKLLIPLKPEN